MNTEQEYSELRTSVLVPLAERVEKHLYQLLQSEPRIDRISARAKTVKSFVKKAEKVLPDGGPKYVDPMNQIQDQIGARIIVFYLSDVERVSQIVDEHFRAIERQDIVPEMDDAFGYVGKHFLLDFPADVFDNVVREEASPGFFELQVKTLFQHAWSEAEHDLGYKPDSKLTANETRCVAYTAAQAWGADRMFEDMFASNASAQHDS